MTNKGPYPLVHIVIINWNQPELTLACLKSLSEQNYPQFQIVLVDNGSTDDSVIRIRQAYPEVTLLETGKNLGYSAGNNVGIQYALEQDAEYLFLLNNDTVVEPNMLVRLVTVANDNPKVGMLGPTIYYFEPPDLLWSAENTIHWFQGRVVRHGIGQLLPVVPDDTPPKEVEYLDSCALLVKRSVVEKIGFLDESFFINFDDADWNIRARKAGFTIMHVPTSHMWHKVSATMGQASPATTYYMTRNVLLFFWKHSRGLARVMATLHVFGRTMRTIAAWTIKPKYRHLRRQRNANILALRDALLRRFGPMGADVHRTCFD